MNPTLAPGSLLVVNRLSYTFSDVQVGDILVFSGEMDEMMIKRCVLVPQMFLQWEGSRLYIPYLKSYVQVRPAVYQSLSGLERVPDGSIFVLGDNVSRSVDSRSYGLVPIAQLQGKVLRY